MVEQGRRLSGISHSLLNPLRPFLSVNDHLILSYLYLLFSMDCRVEVRSVVRQSVLKSFGVQVIKARL